MGKINVFIAGDFFGGNRVTNLIDNADYDTIFGPLLNTIQDSDISVVNLESPLFSGNLNPISKTGPNLKANPNVIEALKYAGFNLLTLANNHILDFGDKGLYYTINLIKEYEIGYVGIGKNIQNAREIKYISKNQKKIAFINFCENEWSTAEYDKAGANPFNIIDNYHDISEAKKNADYVIVIFHGGIEYSKYPSLEFKKTCRFFVDAGADAIICHHSHTASGYEVYKDKPIFYGIGNFIFDNEKKYNQAWNIGFAIKLSIDSELIFEILPYKQCDETVGIVELNPNENTLFNQNLSDINFIIKDDKMLNEKLMQWSKVKEKMYISYMQPYSNKYLKGLFNRKILPSILSNNFYKLILNLIRCESHREVLIQILKNKIK